MSTRTSEASMGRMIGRHAEKQYDWAAFPRSKGYPELDRAQMRYIGAGGSPKVEDPHTLPPGNFTLSIINLPANNYGSSHHHDDCEEIFLGLEGYTTIGFTFGDEVVLFKLGPKDLVLLPANEPNHAYRNDTQETVRFSVMVGKAKPNMPIYTAHPHQTPRARDFGGAEGKVFWYDPLSNDPKHVKTRSLLVRYAERPVHWHPAGFARKIYLGEGGGAPAGNFREDLIHLPVGKGVRAYQRDVEEAYFVLEGVLTVGWEMDGKVVEQQLGPKDVILNPAGGRHYFRNTGLQDAQFMMVVGTSKPEDVAFAAA